MKDPRAWYQHFIVYLSSLGLLNYKSDSSLFTFHRGFDVKYSHLYIDGIILIDSYPFLITTTIFQLSSKFHMSVLGSLSFFLELLLLTIPHVSFSLIPPSLMRVLHVFIWLHVIHAALRLILNLSSPLMVSWFLILRYIVASHELCNTWHLLVSILSMLFNMSVFLCMNHKLYIF